MDLFDNLGETIRVWPLIAMFSRIFATQHMAIWRYTVYSIPVYHLFTFWERHLLARQIHHNIHGIVHISYSAVSIVHIIQHQFPYIFYHTYSQSSLYEVVSHPSIMVIISMNVNQSSYSNNHEIDDSHKIPTIIIVIIIITIIMLEPWWYFNYHQHYDHQHYNCHRW